MPALNLLSLKLFLAAARSGSIAEAARRENLATSAVSKRISDLEVHYGVTLLERSRGGVSVTPAGELMLQHGETILRLVERLESELLGHAKGVRGEVRIAAVTSAILGKLP
ncbi:MAG: LysR family transcriptional regulator, partial [Rhodospirillaceae bacterium]